MSSSRNKPEHARSSRRRVPSFYDELLIDDPKEKARMRVQERRRAAAEAAEAESVAEKDEPRPSPQHARSFASKAGSAAWFCVRSALFSFLHAASKFLRHKVAVKSVDVPVWAFVAAACAIAVVVCSFAAGYKESISQPEPAPEAPAAPVAPPEPQPVEADFSKLPEALDADVRASLEEQAPGNDKLSTIINEADVLAPLGEDSQLQLLKLAAEEPRSYDFILGINERYPDEAGQSYAEPIPEGRIPLLLQWDMRWGYVTYSSAPIGLAGCCPTALSMVYMGLTGNADKTPYDMAMLARSMDCETETEGTMAYFLTEAAPGLGLQAEYFAPDAGRLVASLSAGKPVIINVGKGDFTDGGHFIVACGLADDGTVLVNDPFSPTRSDKTWDAGVLAGQAMGMYAFSKS